MVVEIIKLRVKGIMMAGLTVIGNVLHAENI